MRWIAALLLLAAPLGGACGATGPPTGKAGRPPSATVTENDFGRTVKLLRGQHLQVVLVDRHPFPGSATVWTAASTDPAVLRLAAEERGKAAPARDATYTADFVAGTFGTALLNLTGRTTCEAMAKAACPDRQGQVAVVVN